ncbi:hypothetical protein JOL79_22935 [Microbispora sp. RL4-1S]|uniref:Uncharacterized protein n=1 Tax=Microbispora oryzae TaxID=2806554 RepID=A0A940WJ41_9ACTN|nr:hypothetical protein [Microbispora oryzae]MBP2706669.1 hypothetical protein [Microbispora oryzae]
MTLISVAAVSAPAYADPKSRHRGGKSAFSSNTGTVNLYAGNGRHNQNNFAIDTPTLIDGIQEVSTGNNGSTNTQNAHCHKWPRSCQIHQNQRTYSRN